ncbi:carbohydrate ABC transporter permease [Paenibacillus thermotolerans]|uniref:carbohydrate ABC transporter permease n=1 Tax=Paenibacillus thermotolerans TaxID=3027807 RepID=UPI002367C857|nr:MULTISPECIES: sugar ABC transporter permease [unclassified Paenibacillus]
MNEEERRKGYLLFRWKEYGVGYLFMLPWIIGFSAFVAFPVGWSLYNSFNKVMLTSTGFKYTWVGLDNYYRMLFQNNAYPILLITYFQEMILIIPLILIFSFFVALLLNQRFPGRGFMRTVFFLPVIFATGQVLMELFNQGAGELPFMDQYNVTEIVDQFFNNSVGDTIVSILGKAVIILWYSGVQILIFLAGFQTISKTLYEAIRVDGASPWESFWKITFPGMIPFVGLNAIYTIVDLFTYPFNPVLESVKNNMFNATTGYGYASAMAWLYFGLVLLLIGIAMGLTVRATRGGGSL